MRFGVVCRIVLRVSSHWRVALAACSISFVLGCTTYSALELSPAVSPVAAIQASFYLIALFDREFDRIGRLGHDPGEDVTRYMIA